MPEHTTFLTYLIHMLPNGGELAEKFGNGIITHSAPSWQSWEPPITALLVIILVVILGLRARAKYVQLDEAVVPEDKLSLRTFFEAFLGYFYQMVRDVMGPARAKRYFPIIGASACFVFFGNVIALIPGLGPATSSLNITLGCSGLVFILFNYYGIKANGLGYVKHLCGPWLGPAGIPLNMLIFVVEVISTCVRPITLAVRLMLNMAVDHLLAGIFIGLFALLVPVPVMFLGVIVILVQTLVFTLLSSIYIALATEHEEHEAHGAPAQQGAHAHA